MTGARLERDISVFQSRQAAESRKEAEPTRKQQESQNSAARTSSISLQSMHLGNAAREAKAHSEARQLRAREADDIARKSRDLANVSERVAKAERKAQTAANAQRRQADEKAGKDLAAANESFCYGYEERVVLLEAQIRAQVEAQAANTAPFSFASPFGLRMYQLRLWR